MYRLVAALFFCLAPYCAATDLYVSPQGSDAGIGSKASPFLTLEGARNAVRKLKSDSKGILNSPVNIYLYPGRYQLGRSFALDGQDSGTQATPISYKNLTGQDVVISGAYEIGSEKFSVVTADSPVWKRLPEIARGKVLVYDLASLGLTDFGTLKNRGVDKYATSPMEVFEEGVPLEIARWPNTDARYSKIDAVVSPTSFSCTTDRMRNWDWSQDIWLHGFWGNAWADYWIKPSSFNPQTLTVELSTSPGAYPLAPKAYFYALNMIEELDSAGEYIIDRTNSKLYVWPKTSENSVKYSLSLLETPLIQATGVSFVNFSGLTFEGTRNGALKLIDVSNVHVSESLIRNVGQFGIYLDGTNSSVTSSEIVNCGEEGVRLTGGSRAQLVPGNNLVSDCRIHRISRSVFTYRPCVNLDLGCGNRVENNLFSDIPHSAVLFSGNNHVIQANEIRRACLLTGDAGAIYSSRDWTFRGNRITNNFVHDVMSLESGDGAHGIYLDGAMSQAIIKQNIFSDISHNGVMCGGGRDNIVENNIFSTCGVALFTGDYGAPYFNNIPGSSWNFVEKLTEEGIDRRAEPWASAYPEFAVIPGTWNEISSGNWLGPEGSTFDRNLGWGNQTWIKERKVTDRGVLSLYKSVVGNIENHPVLFQASSSFDRNKRPEQLNSDIGGWAPIPFRSIGKLDRNEKATSKPAVAFLTGQVLSSTSLKLSWSDSANLPSNQETEMRLEARNLPDGQWALSSTLSKDSDYVTLTGLAPGKSYEFRAVAINAVGTSVTNTVTLSTLAAPLIDANALKIEAESQFEILSDIGQTDIGLVDAKLDSGKSVNIYDPGDSLRIAFGILKDGKYRIGLRVRAGNDQQRNVYFDRGYFASIDGSSVAVTGDATSLSDLDGYTLPTVWGMLNTEDLSLKAGLHTFEVTTGIWGWGLVDYVVVTERVAPSQETYEGWVKAHFTDTQIENVLVSGPNASAVNDGYPNFYKFERGLDPWVAILGEYSPGQEPSPTTGPASRLFNISMRARTGTGEATPIVGFAVRGPGSLPVLIRNIGPSLQAFGIENALPDPKLQLNLGQVLVAENDDWSGTEELSSAFQQAGAFSLDAQSRDAALLRGLGALNYTAYPTSSENALGVVLLETYTLKTSGAARLTNLSVRANAGLGSESLIAGFAIVGSQSLSVLIRGIGPTLGSFGVKSALPDSTLTVNQGQAEVAFNNNWYDQQNVSEIVSASSSVGAFNLLPTSLDAVLLLKLEPGIYTATVGSATRSTGVALVEVYSIE